VPVRPRHRLGGYREYGAAPELAPFCEASWIYQTPMAAPPPGGAVHRLLPDPSLSLAFACRRDTAGRPTEQSLVLIGPITEAREVAYAPRHELVAVKLKLEWVEALLGSAPFEHSDALHEVSGVMPRLAGPLADRLSETRDAEAALTILESALAQQRARVPRRGPGVAGRALDLVRRTRGRIPVQQVAHLVGHSARHLRRLVRETAGVSLKAYGRQLRLVHALTTADAQPSPSWAHIAADAGFFDQAHLVRDCKELYGLTPVRLDRERRAEAVAALSNPRHGHRT
jgi:AraC-like DNA-binding protein